MGSTCQTVCPSRRLQSFCFWWSFWQGAVSLGTRRRIWLTQRKHVQSKHARTSTALEQHADHAATGTLLSAPALDPLLLVLPATLSTQMVQNAISSDSVRVAGGTPWCNA